MRSRAVKWAVRGQCMGMATRLHSVNMLITQI